MILVRMVLNIALHSITQQAASRQIDTPGVPPYNPSMEIHVALSFDDVLLVPAKSDILPGRSGYLDHVYSKHRFEHTAGGSCDGHRD